LIYFQIGLKHVLDIYAYDHVLFLIALAVPFLLKIGSDCTFSVALQLAYTSINSFCFWYYRRKVNVVEFLIPITILITALFNLFTAGKSSKESINLVFFITLFLELSTA
jgi:hypothetical protein